jgi:hypothetical protein
VINHIDVSTVLRRTVCDFYSDLVTRPTGAAVRTQIERQLSELPGRTLIIIDFTHVGLLDFSCADEVVAKLLLRYRAELPPDDAYFVFRGVSESHLDALEAVLERHALALVVEVDDGAVRVIGAIEEADRQAWQALCLLGRAAADDVARALGAGREEALRIVEGLCRQRLVMPLDGTYLAVGATR